MGESVVPLSDDVTWGRVNVMLYNVYKVSLFLHNTRAKSGVKPQEVTLLVTSVISQHLSGEMSARCYNVVDDMICMFDSHCGQVDRRRSRSCWSSRDVSVSQHLADALTTSSWQPHQCDSSSCRSWLAPVSQCLMQWQDVH